MSRGMNPQMRLVLGALIHILLHIISVAQLPLLLIILLPVFIFIFLLPSSSPFFGLRHLRRGRGVICDLLRHLIQEPAEEIILIVFILFSFSFFLPTST